MTPTLARATREYVHNLKLATNDYLDKPEVGGRAGTIRALMATVTFIQEVASRYSHEEQLDYVRLTEPFATLATALQGLKNGEISPVVRAAPVSNRRVLPSGIRIQRAIAAAGVELHEMAGSSRQEAIKRVVSQLKDTDAFEGSKVQPAQALAAWLKQIRGVEFRVKLEDMRAHHHARFDVAVFDYYVGLASNLLSARGCEPTGLHGYADNLVVHGGWSHGGKKGRANLT